MSYEHDHSVMCHLMNHYDQLFNELKSPFVLLKPKLFVDGDQWCALYGENIQDGVCGFGITPYKAQCDFDTNWYNQKPRE